MSCSPALSALLTLAIAAGVGLLIRHHAVSLGLLVPPNERSSHQQPTAQGGGAGIVIAVTLVFVGLMRPPAGPTYLLLATALPLAWVGWLDDRRSVSAKWRFIAQLATASALALISGLPAPSGEQTVAVRLLPLLVILSGVWWINLFNFMDGIDGIAGSQAVSMLVSAGVLISLAQPEFICNPTGLLALLTASATLGFLLLNWPPARIFMGDVGSTWLAFVIYGIALLTVRDGQLQPATWLILGASFITDATVTLVTRMARGERWTQAHRVHAYQRLSRRIHTQRTSAHRRVTAAVLAVNLLWLAPLASICEQHSDPAITLITLGLAYLPLVAAALKIGAGQPERY